MNNIERKIKELKLADLLMAVGDDIPIIPINTTSRVKLLAENGIRDLLNRKNIQTKFYDKRINFKYTKIPHFIIGPSAQTYFDIKNNLFL